MEMEDSYFRHNNRLQITQNMCKKWVAETLYIISTVFLGSISAYSALYLLFKLFPIHIELPVIQISVLPNTQL